MLPADQAPFAVRLPANALVALAAAASWGGGDFSGGMGVKAAGGTARGALRVILFAHLLSLAALLVILLAGHAAMPHDAPMFWGLGAGVAAGLSVAAFYIALSRGAMGASAAISGLLAAAIPVAVSVMLEGAPGTLKAAGFLLTGISIWLIAAAPTPHDTESADKRGTMGLAILGGIGFGVYFIALKLANPLGTLEPTALARIASIATCAVLLLLLKPAPGEPAGLRLNKTALLWCLSIAVLDTGGNLLFTASTRMGRLDVASVLVSLYPASTILLAAWHLHERPTRRQGAGMLLALAAVVIITL